MMLDKVNNIDDLSLLLGVKKASLTYFAYIIPSTKKYTTFKINKNSGGQRAIAAPIKGLKDIQTAIYHAVLPFYKPRSSVHGYVHGKGIISNASAHKNQRWLGRIDIKSFFPSIHVGRIRGLFHSPPFNLPNDLSILLAKLCTHKNRLPQGAPTSPILSNLIVRRLDAKIGALARKNRCYYTRYADDIFISTNQRIFPTEILFHDDEGATHLGTELEQIFKVEDFKVNSTKLSLKDKSKRQIVTGLVVNEKPNVPREYVREIRAMLYSWEKHGLDAAERHWQTLKLGKRNRFVLNPPRFRWVLRGKLAHMAAVKGKTDPVYLSYAKRLAQLDRNFTLDIKAIAKTIASEIRIFAEGKTDIMHLQSALEHFQEKGQFTELKLVFPENKKGEGEAALKDLCTVLSSSPQERLTICVFDRDVPKTTSNMKGSATDYRDWSSNVYSLVIPPPSFSSREEACIEHYYQNKDLMLKDANGRRLYLKEEFDDKYGIHLTESGIISPFAGAKNKPLIVDSKVINVNTKENVALSKSNFAKNIKNKVPPFDKVDFSEFENIFKIIHKLYADYVSA